MENTKNNQMPQFIKDQLPVKKKKKRYTGIPYRKYCKMRKNAVLMALWALVATLTVAWLAYINLAILNPLVDVIISGEVCPTMEALPTKSGFLHITPPADVFYIDDQPDFNFEIKGKITKASWYHYELNGILWSADHNTAASREFDRGSMVKVTNLDNGKSVTVLINDYGPEEALHPDRELDLSYYAFATIADPSRGIINVSYEKVGVDTNFKSKYDK